MIRSNVEVVAADDDSTIEEWKEVGGVIQRNVEKMSAMIEGLLATARLQTGKAQAVTLDLAGLVRAEDGRIRQVSWQIHEVTLEAHVEPGGRRWGRSDSRPGSLQPPRQRAERLEPRSR